MRRSAPLLLLLSLVAACGGSTGPAASPEVEVTAVTPVLYADGFPALIFTLAHRGGPAAETVRIDVDARRAGTVVDQAVAAATDLEPGESLVTDPAVFASLDSHADYDCYRYRVRTYEAGGETTSDQRSGEVCG